MINQLDKIKHLTINMLDNFTKQSFQLNFVLFFLITRGTFITTSEVKATITFPIKKYKFSLIRQTAGWLQQINSIMVLFLPILKRFHTD